MSEFMNEQINIAHNLINEHQFNVAIEIMENMKLRINDQVVLGEITKNENHIKTEYSTRYQQITGTPYEQYTKAMKLEQWKAKEYLTVYNRIVKDYDL